MSKKRKGETDGFTDDCLQSKKRAVEANVPTIFSQNITNLRKYVSLVLQEPQDAHHYVREIGTDAYETLRLMHGQLNDLDGSSKPMRAESNHRQENGHQSPLQLPPVPPIPDKQIEKAVFTHQGMLDAQHNSSDLLSYERLELLGDAYIEVMATRLIWSRFPKLTTGRLAQLRELLVKNETLREFSERYGFDKRVSIPKNTRIDPKTITKIKSDVFEAYVAALILADPLHGFEKAEDWLTQLWVPKLENVNLPTTNLNAKQDLNRLVSSKDVYIKYIDEGPPIVGRGITTFTVGAYLTGWGYENQHLGSGRGLNKTVAGNEAATSALKNRPLIDEIAKIKKAFDDGRKSGKKENRTKDFGGEGLALHT